MINNIVTERRLEKFKKVAAARTDQIIVVLDEVKNPHNISAVIRSADAFGVSTVLLVDAGDEIYNGVSKGAEYWVNTVRVKSAQEAFAYLKSRDFDIVVFDAPDSESGATSEIPNIPVANLPYGKRNLALVFGNEHNGVGSAFRDKADLRAHIPMLGFVESLNISVACAISLYSSTIQGAEVVRAVRPFSDSQADGQVDKWVDAQLERLRTR